jgi:DNA mismatch endonuclease, patch repair protein
MGRRTSDTRPEISLRRAVHGLGLRFRLRRRLLGVTTPDFVLPGPMVAVYVDGCYWHGCPVHGTVTFKGPNRHLWEQKISANRARDESNVRLLNLEGWTVLRFWECQVKADASACAAQVRAAAASPGDD